MKRAYLLTRIVNNVVGKLVLFLLFLFLTVDLHAQESWPSAWKPMLDANWSNMTDPTSDQNPASVDVINDASGICSYYSSSATSVFMRIALGDKVETNGGELRPYAWMAELDVDGDGALDWNVRAAGITEYIQTFYYTPTETQKFSVANPIANGYVRAVQSGSVWYIDMQVPYTALQASGYGKNIYPGTPVRFFFHTSTTEAVDIKDATVPSATLAGAFALTTVTTIGGDSGAYGSINDTRDTNPYSASGTWNTNDTVLMSGSGWPGSASSYYNSGTRHVRIKDSSDSTHWNGTITTNSSGTFTSASTWTIAAGAESGLYTIEVENPRSAGSWLEYDTFTVLQQVAEEDPEIDVQGKELTISDGDSSPSTLDDTDFGTVDVVSGSVEKTFTIYNLGSAALNLTGSSPYITISGTNSGDFSVTANPSNSISVEGSTTFTIEFNPSGAGTRSAEINIANDDSDENPYNFNIQGTGEFSQSQDSEIGITGNNQDIADGDTSPSTTDGTDFGTVEIDDDSTAIQTYTIKNTGSGTLTISDVEISGDNAGDFTITQSPSGSVATGDSTTLEISFNPSATGSRNAVVTITNNDPDEGTFTFNITGNGISTPAQVSEIGITGKGQDIADGDTTPSTTDGTDFGDVEIANDSTASQTFVIHNTSTGTLKITDVQISGANAGDFTIAQLPDSLVAGGDSTIIKVTFNPSATGARNAVVTITNNDPDEGTFNFNITGAGAYLKEIAVTGNNQNIADGDTSPSTTDGTDFGTVEIDDDSTATQTYTIKNIGSGTLTISDVEISGDNAGDFTIAQLPDSLVAGGDSTIIKVTFNPSATGARNAVVTITNNDPDEGTFTFNITGNGISTPAQESEIGITGKGQNIADGDTTPSTTDGTDFGTVEIDDDSTATQTYTIKNIGSGTLTISDVEISGDNAGDFTITQSPSGSVAAGDSTIIEVTFNPSATGTRNAVVTITNNDPDEGTFTFNITGNGISTPAQESEIGITGKGQNIADGDTTPSTTDGTDFGTVEIDDDSTATQTYTIKNTGSGTLTISDVEISGANAGDFTIAQLPDSLVAGGDSTMIEVTFNPSATGSRNAVVTVTNNDPDEGTFTFNITGTGAYLKEIAVSGNDLDIVDGDTTPSPADGTDFGTVEIDDDSTVTQVYKIYNTSTGTLKITDTQIGGANAGDFSITQVPDSLIAGGDSKTLEITFNPSATGSRNAVVTITNNDPDEGTFTFNITGTGAYLKEIAVSGNGQNIADGDTTPSTADGTDFGTVEIDNDSTIIKVYKIYNTSTGTLKITDVQISGANAGDFTITQLPDSLIAGGDSTIIEVTFNPSATGARNAVVTITNNDPDEGTFTFNITGNGISTPAQESEIGITGKGQNIADGDTTPSTTDGTDFGTVEIDDDSTATQTYTIKNIGSGTLTISDVEISGDNAGDFTITQSPSGSVAVGDSTTLEISFNPSATGARNAVVTITNNDPDEGTFTFNITGTGAYLKEIAVSGNGQNIADGDTTPSTADGTDFGTVEIDDDSTIIKVYKIYNTSTGTLKITDVQIIGANAGDFTITQLPDSLVAGGDSTIIKVTFNPSATGSRNTVITITNNDPDEGTFTFNITGTGAYLKDIAITGNGQDITDGSTTPGSINGTDFGSVDVDDDSTSTRSFVIKNTLPGTLKISDVQITGPNAGDFTITLMPASEINGGDSTILVITFNPSASGDRTAIVEITNNDPNEGSFTFAIKGNGYIATMSYAMKTNYQDGSSTPGVMVISGNPVRWTYIVTNTGTITLKNITIDDDTLGVVGKIDSLAAGAVDSLYKNGAAGSGLYFGSSTASCVYNGKAINAADSSYYTGVTSSISGLAWNDKNGNGQKETGESILSDIIVKLYDNNNSLLRTDTTIIDGTFLFNDLNPAIYYVEFSNFPLYMAISPMDQGDDASDSDIYPLTAKTAAINLGSGSNITDICAGLYYPAAKLAGRVWFDDNRDGKREWDDAPFSNVTVVLFDSLTAPVDTTVTGSDGKYIFTQLSSGRYLVRFINLPQGYTFTDANKGDKDDDDSDAHKITGYSGYYTLMPGDSVMTVDAGLITIINWISGNVWLDKNSNGKKDNAEKPLPSISVVLLNSLNAILDTTATDSNGVYKFENLDAGSYKVTIVDDTLATSYKQTITDTLVIKVKPGFNVNNANFGFAKITGSVKIVLFNDTDRNGLLDDGEQLLPNVEVVLCDINGYAQATVQTDTQGRAIFTVTTPGNYLVSINTFDEDLPAHFWPTVMTNPFTVTFTYNDPIVEKLVGMNTVTANGQNNVIGDFVWHDSNWNRQFDNNEENLPFVMIYLYKLLGATRKAANITVDNIQLVDSVRTNYFGTYYFTQVPVGSYLVRAHEIQYSEEEEEWQVTSRDSLHVTVNGSESMLDADFGFAHPSEALAGKISAFVWNDLDFNRKYSDDEPGLAGVGVELYKKAVVQTATTDGTGHVTFTNVAPGDYSIRVIESTLPINYIHTTGNTPELMFLPGSGHYVSSGYGYAQEVTWGITPNRLLARYETWFNNQDGRHWLPLNAGGVADSSLIGDYSSTDYDVIGYHILQAWASGIDGFAVDWYGRNSIENQGLLKLFDTIEVLNNKYAANGFHFEALASINENVQGALDSNLVYIADSLLTRPAYWGTERGVKRPIFVFNHDQQILPLALLKSHADSLLPKNVMLVWNGLYEDTTGVADALFPSLETDAYPWSTGAEFNVGFLDTVYTRLDKMNKDKKTAFTIGSVWPGLDDRNWSAGKSLYIDNADTSVFSATWNKVLHYAKQYSIPWTMIQSWNDFNRGMSIEPGIEYGYNYGVLTRDYARKYKAPLVNPDSVGVDNLGMLVPRYIYMARLAAQKYPEKAAAINAQVETALGHFFSREYLSAITVANQAAGLIPPVIDDAVSDGVDITIKWNAVAFANAYYVHVAKDSSAYDPCSFVPADMIYAGNITEFKLSGLEPNTVYYVGVTAADTTLGSFMDSWYQHNGSQPSIIAVQTHINCVTGVDELDNALPKTFAMDQNYPNPFNPTTTIRYALPKNQHVVIKLYNTLGQQVMTLVDNQQVAGFYNIQLDGSALGSGVYFYRITTQDYTATRKLLLVK